MPEPWLPEPVRRGPLLALRPVAVGLEHLPVVLEHPAAVGQQLPVALRLEVAVPVPERERPRLAARLVVAAVVGRVSAAVEQMQSTR